MQRETFSVSLNSHTHPHIHIHIHSITSLCLTQRDMAILCLSVQNFSVYISGLGIAKVFLLHCILPELCFAPWLPLNAVYSSLRAGVLCLTISSTWSLLETTGQSSLWLAVLSHLI